MDIRTFRKSLQSGLSTVICRDWGEMHDGKWSPRAGQQTGWNALWEIEVLGFQVLVLLWDLQSSPVVVLVCFLRQTSRSCVCAIRGCSGRWLLWFSSGPALSPSVLWCLWHPQTQCASDGWSWWVPQSYCGQSSDASSSVEVWQWRSSSSCARSRSCLRALMMLSDWLREREVHPGNCRAQASRVRHIGLEKVSRNVHNRICASAKMWRRSSISWKNSSKSNVKNSK